MNTHDLEREARLQALAEQRERDGSRLADPEVDAYRLVQRAVVRAPVPSIPAGFVARMGQLVRDFEASDRLEARILAVAVACAVVLAVGMGAWMLFAALPSAAGVVGEVPWGMLLAAAAGLAGCGVLDLRQRRSEDNRDRLAAGP